MLPIVLASGSPYRRQILETLAVDFISVSPDIDESPMPSETPSALVERLARCKALALRDQFPEHLIIGSDQIGLIDGQLLLKPGNHDKAKQQLTNCSGKQAVFYTSLCLLNSVTGIQQCIVEPFTVQFRQLTEAQIERYLRHERPYDCAGSFKVEGLGISLFSRMAGDDHNTLMGLPLIQLVTMLNKEGYPIP